MPINMGELLPTSPVMQPPDSPSPASKATDTTATDTTATNKDLEKGLNKDLEKVSEPVLCHHCGRTASNGISCEGYCVADSNY
jgi:hypothetical protein